MDVLQSDKFPCLLKHLAPRWLPHAEVFYGRCLASTAGNDSAQPGIASDAGPLCSRSCPSWGNPDLVTDSSGITEAQLHGHGGTWL